MKKEEVLDAINKKYQSLGEDPETYLKGLLYSKPINYWDYIEVDSLLSLQKPRTDFKDEEVFIMYHQVTELVLKMITHEIKQLIAEEYSEKIWLDKIDRLIRYTSMLITSFDVMKYGMNYDDYNMFRYSLTPASGFQSAQFRYIEIYCTRLENLVNTEGKKRLGNTPTTEEYFEHIYWRDAGMNRKTGKKSMTLTQFEEKYLDSFITLANKVKGNTLEDKLMRAPKHSDTLVNLLKKLDHQYNVIWPSVHMQTAKHYLSKKGNIGEKAATGGSEWKKYLHPKHQQRKFFPNLWSNDEIENWGKNI